ncbi:MAG: adenylate/guanylate cyclase domain-containing protein [Chlorobia bacterium]|nr:adenylate/guanylate cyclase domain-containing protein [Fimbriimonadaceae bacterium]
MGRYRNPREEDRVFLLIDLRNSTPLAESLGTRRFSLLLRDFFDDLTDPVLETSGEIDSYVGDEAIISWPRARGIEDANVLRCFTLFKERIAERASEYQRQFGVVPTFKAAIHAGPVVATEVGQSRTQLVLHGDALNTASRVLGECNALGVELLVTDSVAVALQEVDVVQLEDLGQFKLRGKGESVGLLTMRS